MTAPTTTKPVITTSRAVWRGEHRFEAGPEGRTVPVDADSKTAPGPVETLLNAIATCSGVDVLDILAKRRTPAERFMVNVTATRRSEAPRRVQRLDIEFHIDGAGIEAQHAERAIELIDAYVQKAEAHNAAGLMRREIYKGFTRAHLLKDEGKLADFLTHDFVDMPFQVRPSRPLCTAKMRQIMAWVMCIATAVTIVISAGRSGATKRSPLNVPRSHASPFTLTASRTEL